MNDVVEVEGPSAGGGVTKSSTVICGGWVLKDQPRVASVDGRGGLRAVECDGRPRRYKRFGYELLRR